MNGKSLFGILRQHAKALTLEGIIHCVVPILHPFNFQESIDYSGLQTYRKQKHLKHTNDIYAKYSWN